MDARRASLTLQAAEERYAAGEYEAAASAADSLFAAWRDARGLGRLADRALWLEGRALRELGRLGDAAEPLAVLLEREPEGGLAAEAAAVLAGIHRATGDDAAAVRMLLDHSGALERVDPRLLGDAAVSLGRADLEALAADFPLGRPGAAVVHAELARALALEDRLDSARRVARRVLEAGPAPPEERLARALLEVEGTAADTFRIGAVLPLSGRFAGVGELLREGMEIALAEFREESGGRPPVRLDVRDDGSDPERAVALVRRLEEDGALAVIGPVRSESFAAAARARRNPRLLIVSPTATEVVAATPDAYTLWDRERRERDVARDLGLWIARETGLRRGAVLHPETPAGRVAAEAFAGALTGEGGGVEAVRGYSPEATTFEEAVAAVAAVRPDVVFVSGHDARSVLQIAPQLSYYGVIASLVAGGATWSEPAVVRRLDPFSGNYRVIGTFVDRVSEGTPWERFRARYESEHRRGLGNDMLAPLGHDALALVLAAVRGARLPLPGALSGVLARAPEVVGATGLLRPDPGTSTVGRETLVRVLEDGRLTEPDTGELLARLERARARADSIAEVRADSLARLEAESAGGPP